MERLKLSNTKALCFLAFLILIFTTFFFYSETKSLKYNIFYQYERVPDIELHNLSFEREGQFYANISGFVKLNDTNDQPRRLRQYYKIEPIYKIDENFHQIYLLTEIIKTDYLPPKQIGESTTLKTKKENENILILESESGETFSVVKYTDHVFTDDASLITSQSDYEEFIDSFWNSY